METYDWAYYLPIVFFTALTLYFTYTMLRDDDLSYISYNVVPSTCMYAWIACAMPELWRNYFGVTGLSWLGITLLPLTAWHVKQFICWLRE